MCIPILDSKKQSSYQIGASNKTVIAFMNDVRIVHNKTIVQLQQAGASDVAIQGK